MLMLTRAGQENARLERRAHRPQALDLFVSEGSSPALLRQKRLFARSFRGCGFLGRSLPRSMALSLRFGNPRSAFGRHDALCLDRRSFG